MVGGFPLMPSTYKGVSGDPLLGVTRNVDKDFEVMRPNEVPLRHAPD